FQGNGAARGSRVFRAAGSGHTTRPPGVAGVGLLVRRAWYRVGERRGLRAGAGQSSKRTRADGGRTAARGSLVRAGGLDAGHLERTVTPATQRRFASRDRLLGREAAAFARPARDAPQDVLPPGSPGRRRGRRRR